MRSHGYPGVCNLKTLMEVGSQGHLGRRGMGNLG